MDLHNHHEKDEDKHSHKAKVLKVIGKRVEGNHLFGVNSLIGNKQNVEEKHHFKNRHYADIEVEVDFDEAKENYQQK